LFLKYVVLYYTSEQGCLVYHNKSMQNIKDCSRQSFNAYNFKYINMQNKIQDKYILNINIIKRIIACYVYKLGVCVCVCIKVLACILIIEIIMLKLK
jgi:hypothetical protein